MRLEENQSLTKSIAAPEGLGMVHGGYVLKTVRELADGDVMMPARSTVDNSAFFMPQGTVTREDSKSV